MSCYCPSGYTPTIDFDDCIFTTTATTSGGSYFFTATTGSQNGTYCVRGVFFYEDITNLSFPITNSGTTTSAYTENGTLLVNTQFLVDNSGRILNIQAGGQGFFPLPYHGPPAIQNALWGTGFPLPPPYFGRLNNAGIWTTEPFPPPGQPLNTWIGFSYCLDLISGGTYFIGVAGDDYWRLRINGVQIFESSPTFFTSWGGIQGIGATSWSVFPYTFNSGLNIIEMEGLNVGGQASFAAEIYSGSVTTLSGYTGTTQLSADTIFSTQDFIGQNIPLTSGSTIGTGYTCPEGYSLYTCSGTPYCIQIDRSGLIKFCISNTGLGYDDNFTLSGTYNTEPYWSGDSTNRVIYLTTGGTWCLSDNLGGTCLLEGAYPCTSTCPDLCDTYFSEGVCPTPTPTPTINCSVLDFNAIFDCEVTPTPSVTPTISVTPTTTPTPSPSDPCGGRALDVTISGYTPTPTPTRTPTPTPTPQITRPCAISGTVTYNTVDTKLIFPMSKQFQDCENGIMYYTTNEVPLPSGGTIGVNNVFKADINGISKCISFVGMNLSIMGTDQINLINGPLVDCFVCTPDVTQTPTPTPTPSFTPTLTPTPTATITSGFYIYKQCNSNKYIVQTQLGPTITIGQVFINPSNPKFNDCWQYEGYSPIEPNLPLGSLITVYSGNLFPEYGFNYFDSCDECLPTIE